MLRLKEGENFSLAPLSFNKKKIISKLILPKTCNNKVTRSHLLFELTSRSIINNLEHRESHTDNPAIKSWLAVFVESANKIRARVQHISSRKEKERKK